MIEFARILYGSQNYGLDGPDSDRDYKVLLCPSFDDFYRYHKVDKTDLPEGCDPEHDSPMSVMRFHDLLLSGNPNCIEMLFSTEQRVSVKGFENYLEYMRMVYARGYIAVVWDGFMSALTGLALNAMDRNGNNQKTLSRAYYFMKMAEHIADNGFVIDEGTWRRSSDEANRPVHQWVAYQIRFGPTPGQAIMDKVAADYREMLAASKPVLAERAKAFHEGHRKRLADVRASADVAGAFLRDYVALEVWEEAKKRIAGMDYREMGRERLIAYLDQEV